MGGVAGAIVGGSCESFSSQNLPCSNLGSSRATSREVAWALRGHNIRQLSVSPALRRRGVRNLDRYFASGHGRNSAEGVSF
jgi:hypothetical protein